MAVLTVTPISRSGAVDTLVAAAGGGDEFVNSGNQFVDINNASGGAITVNAVVVPTVDGQTVPVKSISVPAGARRKFGPFPIGLYNNATTGRVSLTYSGVTSLTVGVFSLVPE